MVAVTYDVTRVPAGDASAKATPRKRWYALWVDALIEARMKQARREVAHAEFRKKLYDHDVVPDAEAVSAALA